MIRYVTRFCTSQVSGQVFQTTVRMCMQCLPWSRVLFHQWTVSHITLIFTSGILQSENDIEKCKPRNYHPRNRKHHSGKRKHPGNTKHHLGKEKNTPPNYNIQLPNFTKLHKFPEVSFLLTLWLSKFQRPLLANTQKQSHNVKQSQVLYIGKIKQSKPINPIKQCNFQLWTHTVSPFHHT